MVGANVLFDVLQYRLTRTVYSRLIILSINGDNLHQMTHDAHFSDL